MEEYARAKCRIFARLRPEDDVAIVGREAMGMAGVPNFKSPVQDFKAPPGYFANAVLAPAAEAAAAALSAAI